MFIVIAIIALALVGIVGTFAALSNDGAGRIKTDWSRVTPADSPTGGAGTIPRQTR